MQTANLFRYCIWIVVRRMCSLLFYWCAVGLRAAQMFAWAERKFKKERLAVATKNISVFTLIAMREQQQQKIMINSEYRRFRVHTKIRVIDWIDRSV